MEQRQPVLHAGMAPPLAHRVIHEVVGHRRAERLHISETEALDGFGRKLELRHRHEIERAQLVRGALALRIEAADRLQCVAEEIQPYRLGHARRVEIDDAATHGIVAGLAHGRGAREAVELEPLGNAVHGEQVAGRDRQRLPRDEIPCRHALERGVDGREQDRWAVLAFDMREP